MVKSQYLSRIQADHYAIGRKHRAHQWGHRGWSKMDEEQIQHGGCRHLGKNAKGCISANY